MKKPKRIQLSEYIDADIYDLASAISYNDEYDILDFIEAIDLSIADIEFSEKLFSKLALSIAKEGEDACDMEKILEKARKDAKRFLKRKAG